jgi:putative thioredoxin
VSAPADVSDASFEVDVLDRSEEVPVVVDLWAPWCGPCRSLGPILEKVVGETDGKVVMVKVNVDDNPQVSAAFQVQGIPAVYALKGRKVVNGFIGAQGEAAVRTFVDSLLPTAEEDELAELVAAGDEASFRKVLDRVPDHAVAITGLAELLVEDGRHDEALGLLERIPETPETRRVAALARMGQAGAPAVVDDGVEAKLDALLDQVKDDEAARQEFLDVLELLGPGDARTATYRRKLSARLF